MKPRCFLLCVTIALLGLVQETSAQDAAAVDSHRAAAVDLLKAMQLDKTFSASIESMVDVQIKQNPVIAPYRKVMMQFFAKYMSWESLKDEMAAIYVEEFSEEELKELTEFYKTPLGTKVALKMPQLASKGAEVGMARVQQNLPELQQMIQAEMKRAAGVE